MARVARGYGLSFSKVLDDDWCDTMAADLALDELERVDALIAKGAAIELASFFGLAYHSPRELSRAERDLQLAMSRPRQPTLTREDIEAITRKADAVDQKAQRIARRKRRRKANSG